MASESRWPNGGRARSVHTCAVIGVVARAQRPDVQSCIDGDPPGSPAMAPRTSRREGAGARLEQHERSRRAASAASRRTGWRRPRSSAIGIGRWLDPRSESRSRRRGPRAAPRVSPSRWSHAPRRLSAWPSAFGSRRSLGCVRRGRRDRRRRGRARARARGRSSRAAARRSGRSRRGPRMRHNEHDARRGGGCPCKASTPSTTIRRWSRARAPR